MHTTTQTQKVRRTKSETENSGEAGIKADQEPEEVEKGRVIEREEVWESSCD